MDFSIEAMPGLNLSLMLANKTGANIQMVHVIRKNDSIKHEELENDRQSAEIKFKEILQKFKGEKSSKFDLSYTIKEGKVFKEINEFANTFDDVLVVLTTHGESGFEELFIGGNAYKIVAHSKNPVITVRRNNVPPKIDKIVMPLDITFQTREKVPYTLKLAQTFNSEIHLVSVRLSDFKSIEKKLHQYTKQVASYIEAHNIHCIVEHLLGDNPTDLTLEYSRSVNADLISIMTEQEKNVSNLLLGSYAHQMINKAFIPILSFPNYQLRKITENIWDLGAFNVRS
jgi:nucleotide-binding universal stress UspA family protein